MPELVQRAENVTDDFELLIHQQERFACEFAFAVLQSSFEEIQGEVCSNWVERHGVSLRSSADSRSSRPAS